MHLPHLLEGVQVIQTELLVLVEPQNVIMTLRSLDRLEKLILQNQVPARVDANLLEPPVDIIQIPDLLVGQHQKAFQRVVEHDFEQQKLAEVVAQADLLKHEQFAPQQQNRRVFFEGEKLADGLGKE